MLDSVGVKLDNRSQERAAMLEPRLQALWTRQVLAQRGPGDDVCCALLCPKEALFSRDSSVSRSHGSALPHIPHYSKQRKESACRLCQVFARNLAGHYFQKH